MGRILLIEGDMSERLVLSRRFESIGHQLVGVENGAKGLVEARSGRIDLVLLSTDLGGGVDATEVCRRLKATPGLLRMPVLVYSQNTTSSELADRMYDAGCDAFLAKAQANSLERVVAVHLRLKAQGDELTEQNRLLERENRRLDAEGQLNQSRAQLGAAGQGEVGTRPDGLLIVDEEGIVRDSDRGAVDILGGRLNGASLGKIAPGCGLEAFVRDARATPRQGFRFQTSARRDRSPRSLMASVHPVGAGEGQPLRVVLLHDLGKRRVAEQMSGDSTIPAQQLGALLEAARMTYVPGMVTGTSPQAEELRERIRRMADSSEPVLLSGERGVGKEWMARILHFSAKHTGPFMQLRCGSMKAKGLEAELFGTSATSKKSATPGILAMAADGAVFLGDVCELPMELQERLVDVIKTKAIRTIASKVERLECRIIASCTEGPLEQTGRLHPGLVELIGTRKIEVPPLRERTMDLPDLAQSFLMRYGPGCGVDAIAEEVIWVMEDYPWPGNTTELEECIEQACHRAQSGVIEVQHLTRPLRDHAAQLPDRQITPAARPSVALHTEPVPSPANGRMLEPTPAPKPWAITEEDPISLDLYEKKVLLRALDSTGGDKLVAAKLLQVGKSTLYRKLKKFGIS